MPVSITLTRKQMIGAACSTFALPNLLALDPSHAHLRQPVEAAIAHLFLDRTPSCFPFAKPRGEWSIRPDFAK
jgi:hypothetical protein